ncbi:MAG TPA: hypothetical protein DCR94_03915 [Firmicutes bacterium]|nr:hypothetical protein [Bacillota bacterium]
MDFAKKYYDVLVTKTPFKKNASKVVKKLKEEGHAIIILTSRDNNLYLDPYKTTTEELKNGGIIFDKLICEKNKAKVCQDEGIELLIDDLAYNCLEASKLGINSILFASPSNTNCNIGNFKVSDWDEVLQVINAIKRGYPNKKEAKYFLDEAEKINPGKWVNHSKIAALCAYKIAKQCNLNENKAYVLGLLHDIGRRFLVRDLGHIYNGYKYMKRVGMDKVAKVCLTHSFPTKNINSYIGKIDISEQEKEEVKRLLSEMEYDDYDRLIQLCDAQAGTDAVLDIEERMKDVKNRYGNYPKEQWDKNLELKRYFEEKCGKSIYEICNG